MYKKGTTPLWSSSLKSRNTDYEKKKTSVKPKSMHILQNTLNTVLLKTIKVMDNKVSPRNYCRREEPKET